MKTYRDEIHGFEIDLPEEWVPVPAVVMGIAGMLAGPFPRRVEKDVFQYGCYDEAFNFEIGPIFPAPLPGDTEREFSLYARDNGYQELVFGRIMVGGKEHVCAAYFIDDRLGKRWNKKYILDYGRIEYSITATCHDPIWFTRREKDWDGIVRTFRLVAPVDDSVDSTGQAERYRTTRRAIIGQRLEMREMTGDLYVRAYEMVSVGQCAKARPLLEECLRDNPDHVLAHKELAVALKKLGDMRGAVYHRKEVKRLHPSDLINRANLIELVARSGKKGEALKETREALTIAPDHPTFLALENKLRYSLYPDYRMAFWGSLICLVLSDVGIWSGTVVAKDAWLSALLMLVPVYGMFVSGPWVGIPKIISGLVAVALYALMFK